MSGVVGRSGRKPSWTPQMDLILREGWKDGDPVETTCVRINKICRVDVTRNACISRAYRIGLPMHPAVPKSKAA